MGVTTLAQGDPHTASRSLARVTRRRLVLLFFFGFSVVFSVFYSYFPVIPALELVNSHQIKRFGFSPDGSKVFAWYSQEEESEESQLRVWKVDSGLALYTLSFAFSDFGQLTFSPNGAWLVANASAGEIKLYSLRGGEPIATINRPGEANALQATGCRFSPDSRFLVFQDKQLDSNWTAPLSPS